MATLRGLTELSGSTLNEDNPFYFVDIWGDASFEDDDRLRLNDRFRDDDSGRFYMVVKAEYEVRLRIRSRNWGYFKDTKHFTADTKAAYDITFDSPFFADGYYKSSMTATFRGGSMLAVTVDGDKGEWHTKGSTFSNEARHPERGISPPNVLFVGPTGPVYSAHGVMMSLTAPYGDYSVPSVRNFIWSKADNDMRIDLISYSRNEGEVVNGVFQGQSIVPTIGDVVAHDTSVVEPYIDLSGWGRRVVVSSGTDINGDPWRVELLLNRDSDDWFIFVDGTMLPDGYSDSDDDGYERALEQARLTVEARKQQAKVKDEDKNSSKDTAFAVGAGSVVVVALAVILVVVFK